MKVGVFDSGIGGLSVVKSILEHNLFEEIIYFGDTARVPYGSKDKNTIIRYAIEAVEFFKNFEIDLIIVACNTVSAYALQEMGEAAKCPVIGVVEAGVQATINALKDKNSNILILGTKATVNSKAYENALMQNGYQNLNAKATGLFVPLVEDEIYDGEIIDAVFKHYFDPLESSPDALILGCTHFPLISDALQNYFGKETKLIHSGEAIVEQMEKKFKFTKKYTNPTIKFFASENPDALKNVAHKWLGLK
ncbi:MAG: glutamate racemase [Campylobacterales bacterium]|nr:glutamate racemase [Campylobacterales bacterium]